MVARTTEERAWLREGGHRLGAVLAQVAQSVRPGVSLRALDALAEQLILASGGKPAFKGYRPSFAAIPYPGSLCTSVNAEVVHGVPTREVILQAGDIVSLDIGMRWPAEGGLFTDTAVTVPVGVIAPEAQRLLTVTADALAAGIAQAVVGHRIRDIARSVQRVVERAGYSVVRDLVGHGVGRAIHEEPQVPNFWDRGHHDASLSDGLVIAIEPMVAAGRADVRTLADGWTVATVDGSLSAHFEHSILITSEGTEVLTRAG
ncbi:type I methionyl aminopeptidase [Candidatus Uhrbacteria bacterium]|nr:type I methionyl aminopeptidase [Candidatus Uhrbacteria bacterium]